MLFHALVSYNRVQSTFHRQCARAGGVPDGSGAYGGALPKHMVSDLSWAKYISKKRKRKKDLVKKTFKFLLGVISSSFHRSLVALEESTLDKIDSARLPTLVSLNRDIKSIIMEEWTGELEAVLVDLRTR